MILLDNPIHVNALERAINDLHRHFPAVVVSVVDPGGGFMQKAKGPMPVLEKLGDIARKQLIIELFKEHQAIAEKAKALQTGGNGA